MANANAVTAPSTTATGMMAANKLAQNRESSDLRWFIETFGVKHPKQSDFLRIGKSCYQNSEYSLSIRCLEMYLSQQSQIEVVPALHLLAHANLKVWPPSLALCLFGRVCRSIC
jgi:hypothetical protein